MWSVCDETMRLACIDRLSFSNEAPVIYGSLMFSATKNTSCRLCEMFWEKLACIGDSFAGWEARLTGSAKKILSAFKVLTEKI